MSCCDAIVVVYNPNYFISDKISEISTSLPFPNSLFIVDKDKTDMSYFGKAGANTEEYGYRAAQDLIKVKGKGFTREKNKKKRGSGVHGKIDQNQVHSIKFDNWSDSD